MNREDIEEQVSEVEGIAVIGLDGRFPQAKNIEEFWQNLSAGKESITFLSEEQMRQSGIASELQSDPNYVAASGKLEDADLFDAAFFGYSPREAELMDPQQRVFLECAWSALEQAGYASTRYEGLIGVYASASRNAYLWFNLLSRPDILEKRSDHELLLGNEQEFLATRVSYKLDLKGPGVTIQTACSSSLVAIHTACQSLLSYQCDMALAGGVAVGVPQKAGHIYEEEGPLSPDGHCRAFDAQAGGTVASNGVGVVVLKRLSDALAEGDTIHAVIRGSAVTNDGANKIGFTAPGVDGQADAIVAAQALADVHPETITYIEAHGTGTILGDPIEVAALTQAFRLKTEKKNFCALGSVKSNIGHLDSAAGVTGLIKTVLSLEHQQLLPNINFTAPNPKIDFRNSPFYVNTQLQPWHTHGFPRRAGVSSFGLGGTNAHVVVEEAPVRETSEPSRPYQLFVLSAKTKTALDTASQNLARHLRQHTEQPLADIAYTYQIGRETFPHRRMVVGTSAQDVASMLELPDHAPVFTGVQEAAHRSVVFMFPGGGTQYADMARQLYELEPVFREQIDHLAKLLYRLLDLDIRLLLYPEPREKELVAQRLKKPSLCLPAIFMTEYALARLWMSWGIQPQAMIGHSLGEYVAACLAGVFSVEDALALVTLRGQLAEQLPDGAMLSLLLSEQETKELLSLDERLSLAVVNGPSQCVVSGPVDAIDMLEARLTEQQAEYRRIAVSGAGHSTLIEPILDQFTTFLKNIPMHPPQIPYMSNLHGTWITAEEACDPLYWARHFRFTVRFKDSIAELMQEPGRVFLEVGPGQSLSSLVRSQLDVRQGHVVLHSLRRARDQEPDLYHFLTTLGHLWMADVPIDWQAFYAHERRQRIPLPTYPFERQRFWIEPQGQVRPQAQDTINRGMKNPDIGQWFYTPSWKRKAVDPLPESASKARWLILLDKTQPLGLSLVEQLRRETDKVLTVFPGERFAQIDENTYSIAPNNIQDYEQLCQHLRARDVVPQKIVSLWSVFSLPEKHTQDWMAERCFYHLLFLAQALDKAEVTQPLQLYVISNESQEVLGNEHLTPEKALSLGPCRVIPQEYSHISARAIDIVLPQQGTHDFVRQQLLSELQAEADESVVAYRGRYRWVQDFEPVRLARQEQTWPLRQEGVYLLTGGLGGVALAIGEYLAEAVQARLILLGRSSFPDRTLWEEWLNTHDEQDRTSTKIRQLQMLEQKGASVLVVSADVVNEQQMRSVIDEVEHTFGALHGVIHSAAIAGEGVILGKTCEKAASILAPKVQGTRVLEAILKDRQIDFLVLCSSLTAISGGVGQLEYCAANNFLDSFAHYWSATYASRAISIGWGDVWQVGGVVDTLQSGVVPHELRAMREEAIAQGISPQEGFEAFSYLLLNQTPAQMIVSSRDLDTAIHDPLNQFTRERFMEEVEKFQRDASMHERPNLLTRYVAPETELQERVVQIWQEVLGIEPIGIDDNFFELGGHSLLGIRLMSRLRAAFDVKLAIRLLFETPTVASLALVIEEALLAEIEQLSDEQAENLVKLEMER